MKYPVHTLGKRDLFCILGVLSLLVLGTSAWGCGDREPEFGGRLETDSGKLLYTVRLECLTVTLEDNAKAAVYVTSYTVEQKNGGRPVSFIFNGGPGSSSVWLHMGLLGPKRISPAGDGSGDDGAPPYTIRSNSLTLLTESDLVFVDPVGTGFSHVLGETEPDAFWGVEEDAEATAQLIRRYLSRHGRWNVPRYLIGESYGTIRIAAALDRMEDDYRGTSVNGVVLISPALYARTFIFSEGNDLPFVLFLPTLAAVAHYHGLTEEKDFQELIENARQFAESTYLQALFRGSSIESGDKERLASTMSSLTGLSKEFLLRSALRVTPTRFMKELLRHQGRAIGRLDGRITTPEVEHAGDSVQTDPSRSAVDSAILAAFWDVVLRPMSLSTDREYQTLNFNANRRWRRAGGGESVFSGFLNVSSNLRKAMARNRDLRVLIINGYQDLTTAFFAAEYLIDHADLDPERVLLRNYNGGHMMYLDPETFDRMSRELARFVRPGAR